MNGRCATLPRVSAAAQPPRSIGAAGPQSGLTADEVAAIVGGRLLHRSVRTIRGAAVDSRVVEPDQLFVALPGEHTDGHAFLGDAAGAGAAAVLVTRPPADPEALGDVAIVLVDDALRALQALAAAWRRRFEPLVVGITGSIAKTSTKEAVATVLARRFRTLKSEGNQNNEIGLPLTVLRLGPEHEAAVLEMGMYVGGEIRDLARIGQPRIGIVTAVQPVHLSRIGSLDAVEDAKAELVEELPAAHEGGVAILNADDERARRMAGRTLARPVTYGFSPDADVHADDVTSAGTDGMRFTLAAAGVRQPVAVPALGRLAVHNGLAAAAVGLEAGLGVDEIAAGLAAGWSAPHRAELHIAGGVTIVDDSYNASPGSVVAALELLGGLPGRRIAVLGEMLELGETHEEGHERVGRAAAEIVDGLVVVGAGATGIARGAQEAGLPSDALAIAADREAALSVLRERLAPGDVVLVKASRGIELDLLVDTLRAELAAGTAGPPGGSAGR